MVDRIWVVQVLAVFQISLKLDRDRCRIRIVIALLLLLELTASCLRLAPGVPAT